MGYRVEPDRSFIEWWSQRNPATTLVTVDTDGTTLVPTLDGTETAYLDDTGAYINEATTTTVNTVAGWTSATFTAVQYRFEPILVMTTKTGANATDIQACIIRCGWGANEILTGSPSLNNAVYFDFTPGTSANWIGTVVTNAGSATTLDTGIAVAANTRYVLKIVSTSTYHRFYINDSLRGTISSGLPSDSTGLNYTVGIKNTTGGTARNIRIQRIYCRHK